MMRYLLTAVLVVSTVAGAGAQVEAPSRVSTSASAEVTVPAFSAQFTVGAVARADKAKDAGARVAVILAAVRDALVRQGLDRNGLRSAGYSVGLEETDGTRPAKAYTASSSISIELSNLDQLGAIIDTALGAGATEISAIRFLPENADAVRGKALELAFARARRDAEALAAAAGGRLGAVIVTSTDRGGLALYETASFARGAGTTIPAPEVKVSASVQVQWRFEASPVPGR